MNDSSEPSTGVTTTTELSPDERFHDNSLGRQIRSILGSQSAALFLVLVVLAAFFSALRPDAFPRVDNVMNMATNASILLVLAVGSTFVILTGGIDLSINGILVFSGVIAAMAMVAVGGDNPGVLFIGLVCGGAAGTAWGALNGFLVARAKIPALIVTLGTMGMSLGLALLLTHGVDISDVPDSLVLTIGSGRLGGIPILVIITAVVAFAGALTLMFTRFGRYTYAVGSSAEFVPTGQHRCHVPPDQSLYACRNAFGSRRLPFAGEVRHDYARRPHDGQSSGNRRRRDRRHESIRRLGRDDGHRNRHHHPCHAAQWLCCSWAPTVLATSCRGSGAHRRGLFRPAAEEVEESLTRKHTALAERSISHLRGDR